MGAFSVVVENVSKKFSSSLRHALRYGLSDSGRRLLGLKRDEKLRDGEFWALQDIDFSLLPGDALGIMGVNGSGKTTLLRILNGTYSPDKGRITFRGRMGALIAAGAGFSPMLTGRENIHISAALLGMSPLEIRTKFDEIIDFAGLGEFIDMPIKNYSSGMSVRLGFAIAAIGTPEILLVDEVLAVGDISFQKKCYERIQQMRNNGATILLVSHSPGAIWSVCNKAIVIHHGLSSGVLGVEAACREYENNNLLEIQASKVMEGEDILPSQYGGVRGGSGTIFVNKLLILDENKNEQTILHYGQDFILQLRLNIIEPVNMGILRIQVDSELHKAVAIIDSYEISGQLIDFQVGEQICEIKVKNPNLRPGIYSLSPSILNKDVGVHLYFEYNLAKITILHSPEHFFYADFRAAIQLNANIESFKS
jgi:lipopolysaccharide transport system ATP-binding protein